MLSIIMEATLTTSSVPLFVFSSPRDRTAVAPSFHAVHFSKTLLDKDKLSFRCRSRRRSVRHSQARSRFSITCGGGGSGVTEINETQFAETVLKSDRPVLVEFVANWCGPCRLISPVIESLPQINHCKD